MEHEGAGHGCLVKNLSGYDAGSVFEIGTVWCRFSNEGKACSVTTDGYYDDTEWGDNGWRTSRGHFKVKGKKSSRECAIRDSQMQSLLIILKTVRIKLHSPNQGKCAPAVEIADSNSRRALRYFVGAVPDDFRAGTQT